MPASCSDCHRWITARVTNYEDGSRVFNYQAPNGYGRCEALGIETIFDFGCNKFDPDPDGGHIEVTATKTGSPWHHSRRDVCPDCAKGCTYHRETNSVTGPIGTTPGMVAGGTCQRCCGTGSVLYYDDGHVGEEKTRRHPNEAAVGPPPKPKCGGCDREIEATWVACPFCGHNLAAAEAVRTSNLNGSNL